MVDRVLESRHKFVYYDDESIDKLRTLKEDYVSKINSVEPIVVYDKVEVLPCLDTDIKLDRDIIMIFHEHYYGLVIFLLIVRTLYNNIDNDLLNNGLKRVFKLCSDKREINSVKTLIDLLIESIDMYKEAYLKYMKTGECNFYDKVPVPFVMIDSMVPYLKKAIGLEKYFALMLEFDVDVSLFNSMAINNYIASRCNGYLSLNVLLESDITWNSYYANNGQVIQETHDYTEMDFRKNKIRRKSIQK